MFNLQLPILLAPMAGAADIKMAIAVANAGGLGSLACAMLSADKIREEVSLFRKACPRKLLNLNFFCHPHIELTTEAQTIWKNILSPYYNELKVPEDTNSPSVQRTPFNEDSCKVVEELKPEVVSFHFGLPHESLLKRVKATGAKIISSATTVAEARYLEQHGCDAIIAQGFEAGGHRGTFLTNDMSTQMGTMALVPLIVDNVKIPVIAAGAISDGRGMAAAMILGASYVQIGTAYLFTHEAKISPLHQTALLSHRVEETALTNVFTGKPARSIVNKLMKEIGPINKGAPPFPNAGTALAPLKATAEKNGNDGFQSLWSGQAGGLIKEITGAEELTKKIASESTNLSRNQL